MAHSVIAKEVNIPGQRALRTFFHLGRQSPSIDPSSSRASRLHGNAPRPPLHWPNEHSFVRRNKLDGVSRCNWAILPPSKGEGVAADSPPEREGRVAREGEIIKRSEEENRDKTSIGTISLRVDLNERYDRECNTRSALFVFNRTYTPLKRKGGSPPPRHSEIGSLPPTNKSKSKVPSFDLSEARPSSPLSRAGVANPNDLASYFERFLCLDNEHIFGDDQGYTPEVMDEILTTARDLELEVNEEDIEELKMGHEDELTTEEFQEILNEEHTQKHSEMCLLLNKRKTKDDQCRHVPLKIFLKSFCASYKEATLYEASATFATPPEIKPGSFAQFVHDNADFNINTIDGKAPCDYNTIYTAMKTSIENAKQLDMRTCILTFDQPLYMKAWDIASAVCLSDEVSVVVRLGYYGWLHYGWKWDKRSSFYHIC
ncbi:hypothetical protein TNCV_3940841 [Trichonephila clavipes]|uniref:Uncharacterized protein n=1 Tax=Trichonephila clavipes TaxID=2585209 RepID=A0A8X7B8S2_TRICX|nr:hypothetical protein TNCV_3940841 [Trichonephila clavipes]